MISKALSKTRNPSEPETLKIKNCRFVLEEVSTPKLRKILSCDSYWKTENNDSYSTLDLGAAAKYRRYADEFVEKLFKRAFQEHYDLPDIPQLPMLDHHQKEGIEWILRRKRSYLAHAPGAGKTAQALIAAHYASGEGQNVFIVPPGLVMNWQREFLKVSGWIDTWPCVGIVQSSDLQDRVAWRATNLIVPDSMLTREWVYERLQKLKKKVVVVDEASRLKDEQAERSIAFYGGVYGDRTYRGLFQEARHVVFMDGSPMPNRPMELWAPAYSLHPEAIDCRNKDDFGYRYCGAKANGFGQWEYLWSSHEKELHEKLTKDFMHVVREEELTHPQRLRSILFMDEDVRTARQKTWEIKNLETLSFINEDSSLGETAQYRRDLGISKAPWVIDYVRQRVHKNESVLLFCWHREVADLLFKGLNDNEAALVYGGTSPEDREKAFRCFQEGDLKVLVMNISAAARGHNLQRADRVIFAEYSWTDELNKQAEKRASRKGSTKMSIRCEYIVVPDSLDEIVLRSVFAKEKRVKKVIG